jgi:hypothetical protein
MSKKSAFTCNICGLPDMVEYMEKDEDTGAITLKKHMVPCLGHDGVHPLLWNMHPEHDKFKKFYLQQKNKSKQNKE